MSMSPPAQMIAHVAETIAGIFRRGAVSSSTGLTGTTVAYADQHYSAPAALVPFALNETPATGAEVVTANIQGQPVLLGKLVRDGLTPAYSPVPVVSSLPTAGAGYRGVMLRTAGASGVADGVYVCVKSAANGYSWVRVDNESTVSAPLGALGVANKTSSQGGIGSETTISSLSVTASVGTGRYVKVTLSLAMSITSTGNAVLIKLKQDGSVVQSFYAYPQSSVSGDSVTLVCLLTPSSGSRTYTVTGTATPYTLTVASGQMIVEDVGAV